MKTAVLIPCYNEAMTIKKVVTDFRRVLPDANIYIYDNNSTDGTDKIAWEAGAIVRYEHRQGKGNVIRTMFREIDADCFIMVDGDDTYPAEDASKMEHMILEDHVDMVIGDRLSSTYFAQNKRLFHNTGNRVVRVLVNRIFKSDIQDMMTGYRAFSRLFVKSFPVLSKGFEIETEMSIHALDKKFYIVEFPIQYRDRPEGSSSKLNTVSDGLQVLLTIFNLYRDYKPLAFFSWVSIILWIVALIIFIPAFTAYLHTGLVMKFPSVIVSVAIMVMAMLMWVCGIILDVLMKRDRREFELFLNLFANKDGDKL